MNRAKVKIKPVEQIIMPAEYVEETVSSIMTITESEASMMVDEGYKLRKQISKMEERLSEIRDKLMTHAKENSVKIILGEDYKYVVIGEDRWTLSPVKLVKWLSEHDMVNLFPKVVSVVKAKVEHEIGGHVLEKIGKSNHNDYAKGLFKPKDEE